jgi:hypothetical protein
MDRFYHGESPSPTISSQAGQNAAQSQHSNLWPQWRGWHNDLLFT